MTDRPLTEGSWDHVRALIDLGRNAQAADELRRLIASDPNEPLYAAWLARCLVDEEPEQAEEEAMRAISLDPSSPLAFEALARARWGRGEHGRAVEAATTLTQLTPYDPRAFALLAHCAALHGRHAAAREAADAAVQMEPNDPVVWTARAHAALARNRFKSAEADARRALELDPEHAAALEVLSYILTARGRLEESIDVAEGLSHLEPGRPDALRAAQTAAASAVLIALPLGFTVGRIVAAATRPAIGPIPAVVIGVGTTIVLLRTAQRLVDRCLEQNDPRTALRKLRRATRLTIGGFFGALALFFGGVGMYERAADRGPASPEQAVDEGVPAADQIELVTSGEWGREWALVAYGSDDGFPCAAFTGRLDDGWRVLKTVCVHPQMTGTRAKSLPLGSGRMVLGVAASDIVELRVSGAPGAEVHGIGRTVEGSNRGRFAVLLPHQGEVSIDEIHEDGSRGMVIAEA